MDLPVWPDLDDEALLDRKISQLGLTLPGTPVQAHVEQLHAELAQKGLAFLPPCHVGDEWFMRLIRHEAAHAYAFAYQFMRKRKWQRVFGRTSRDTTPQFYRPRPYSRSYVVHLDDWYAQSHPDEDFAETFAVWLTPGLDWRTRFKGWKALQKLEYVDELMRSIAGQAPPHQPAYRVKDFDCLNIKLKTYYARKRKEYEDTYPDFYDRDLRQLFAGPVEGGAALKASAYLRQRRRPLLDAVCESTNEKKYR